MKKKVEKDNNVDEEEVHYIGKGNKSDSKKLET
jgi:hypothetical protein